MSDAQDKPKTDASAELDGLNVPQLVIISGMSGAGRTEAMHVFEDLGYY